MLDHLLLFMFPDCNIHLNFRTNTNKGTIAVCERIRLFKGSGKKMDHRLPVSRTIGIVTHQLYFLLK